MLPMKCPQCGVGRFYAVITNNVYENQTVRKRQCRECRHVWFTVELQVSRYAVGWSNEHMRKPVLRVPVELSAEVTPGGLADAPDEEL